MGLNVGRWLKYAQAKLDRSVSDGHDELADLEAQREAEIADRPWLASEGEAPTFDEARARIEWEAEEQRRRSERDAQAAEAGKGAPPASNPPPADGSGSIPTVTAGGTDAVEAEDPEVTAARAELAARELASKERLEAIRRELGVDPPSSSEGGG